MQATRRFGTAERPVGQALPRVRDLGRCDANADPGHASCQQVRSADGSIRGRVYRLDDGDYLCLSDDSLGHGALASCHLGLDPLDQPTCFKRTNVKECSMSRRSPEVRSPAEYDKIRTMTYDEAANLAAVASPLTPSYLLDQGHELSLVMALQRGNVSDGMWSGGTRARFRLQPPAAGASGSQEASTAALTSRAVHAFLLSAGETLAHAHAHGLRHSDLRPANLLVPPDGDGVVVADFNCAHDVSGSGLNTAHLGQIDYVIVPPEVDFDLDAQALLTRADWLKSDVFEVAALVAQQSDAMPVMAGSRSSRGLDDPVYLRQSQHLRRYHERVGKGLPVAAPRDADDQSIVTFWQGVATLAQPLPRLLAAMFSVQPSDRPSAQELVAVLRAHPLPAPAPGEGRWDATPWPRETRVALARARALRSELVAAGTLHDGPLHRSLVDGQRSLPARPRLSLEAAELSVFAEMNMAMAAERSTVLDELGIRLPDAAQLGRLGRAAAAAAVLSAFFLSTWSSPSWSQ